MSTERHLTNSEEKELLAKERRLLNAGIPTWISKEIPGIQKELSRMRRLAIERRTLKSYLKACDSLLDLSTTGGYIVTKSCLGYDFLIVPDNVGRIPGIPTIKESEVLSSKSKEELVSKLETLKKFASGELYSEVTNFFNGQLYDISLVETEG